MFPFGAWAKRKLIQLDSPADGRARRRDTMKAMWQQHLLYLTREELDFQVAGCIDAPQDLPNGVLAIDPGRNPFYLYQHDIYIEPQTVPREGPKRATE